MSSAIDVVAEWAWLDGGWASAVRLAADAEGRWLEPSGTGRRDDGVRRLRGWVLPGPANLHSHAFQRAMAGRAERRGHSDDSFWTWRETMYRLAARFDPDSLRAVAAWLYAEMLEAGYTSVCEFHYLHHDPTGRPYADPAAMSLALVEAAREAGIRLTLLPVLYRRGGFDGRPLSERQRRFGHDLDAFLALLERLISRADGQCRVGAAFHSLRAVSEGDMSALTTACAGRSLPIHIHIAEQQAEVEECLALRRTRPVRWLLDRMPVDSNWTLVHATHLDESECRDLAASGATVALCPSTEANLGDGLFPLTEFLAAGGHWGIGSDSHVSVDPVEELRWLEYGQRLRHRRRNLAAGPDRPSVGESLLTGVLASARAAGGWSQGALTAGCHADCIVLDPDAPALCGHGPESILDAWIFAGNRPAVREVWVGGRRRVEDGRHRDRDRLYAAYRRAIAALTA